MPSYSSLLLSAYAIAAVTVAQVYHPARGIELDGHGYAGTISPRSLLDDSDLYDELETLTAREISLLNRLAERELRLMTTFDKRDEESGAHLFRRECINIGAICITHDTCGGIKNGCICGSNGVCAPSTDYDSGTGRKPKGSIQGNRP